MTRRLFYAIEFPDDVRSRLSLAGAQLAALASQGRWTRPDNLHLTLQFIGDCPDEWLGRLGDILSLAAGNCPPFTMQIGGCGTFGRLGDILWIGVAPHPLLQQMAGDIASQLQGQGLPYEQRPYSPHITIGRQVRIDSAALRSWSIAPFGCPVRQITLMESCRAGGPLAYLPLQRARLRA
jgi:2'-5' RNA ligase